MNRRNFLVSAGLLPLTGSLFADDRSRTTPPPRPQPATRKLAVVATVYTYLSHTYHVCGRFLNGYLKDGKYHYPDAEIAAISLEQKPGGDLERTAGEKAWLPRLRQSRRRFDARHGKAGGRWRAAYRRARQLPL